MVLRCPFSSSSRLTPVASLETKSFNLIAVSDNRSSSDAACTRERKVGGGRGSWRAGGLAGPSSKIQSIQTRWKVSD